MRYTISGEGQNVVMDGNSYLDVLFECPNCCDGGRGW